MLEAIRYSGPPASRLPKMTETWEEAAHAEFTPRTDWSLLNAFTEVQKGATPGCGDGLRRRRVLSVAICSEQP
jgi:hypothetical protein